MLIAGVLGACSGPGAAEPGRDCAVKPTPSSNFLPILRDGLAPSQLNWAGREWRVNAGSTRFDGMPHSVAISPGGEKLRVELRDTPRDNSGPDRPRVRRAELSGSLFGDDTRLPNGRVLWGAVSFIHHAWSDPRGMRDLQGGVYGQVHMGSDAGGSPAFALRRSPDGRFRVTTRGEFDPAGTVRYEGPLAFDAVHDLVYRLVLHPTDGSLQLWIDGRRVVDVEGESIGHSSATSYWNVGAYFARGISGTVAAEFANHVYPAEVGLAPRIKAPPCWPAG